jgi:hypothetical protein
MLVKGNILFYSFLVLLLPLLFPCFCKFCVTKIRQQAAKAKEKGKQLYLLAPLEIFVTNPFFIKTFTKYALP